MADMKIVERPEFDFVQTLEQARALFELAETLKSVLNRNRANRDHALERWSGPWGDEFRRRGDEDEDNVTTVSARLRNDADQWGTIWQQAARQTNRCAYAEAVFAKRDEIAGELSHTEEAVQRAADRWADDGNDPLDFVYDQADVYITGADLLVAGVRDIGEAIGNWFGGNSDPMGDALEYVREPDPWAVARPASWNNFAGDGQDFAHYEIGDLIHYRSIPGGLQPPRNPDEVHRIPDNDPAAEPPDHDSAGDRPDPVAVEANRASLGADEGCCSIDLDALDRYLDGFSTVDGRLGDPELFAQYESARATQGPAVESAGLHGRYLDQVALPAVDIYLSFLNFNLLGMKAVRDAVGPNASGVVTVSNAFIGAVLKSHGLDQPPGLIKISDSEFEGLPPNSGFADDPVCMATGNFVHTELDLAMPGFAETIAAHRVYNAAGTMLGYFGFGWSSALDMYVHEGSGSVEVRLADGARISFRVLDDGTYAPQRERRLELVRRDDGWELSQGYDSAWLFDNSGELVGGQEGPAAWTVERTATTITTRDELSGRSIRYELDEETQLVRTATTSDGRRAAWLYDERLCCTAVERASGGHTYEVDDDLRIIAITDADGVEFVRNTYDTWGRVTSQLNQFGRESVYEYEDDGTARIREADTGDLATQMTHDAKANLLSIVGADAGVMRMEWNEQSRKAAVIDRKGQETRYEYVEDARQDLITRTVRPDGLEEHREWDDTGRLARYVNAAGGVYSFDYERDSRAASRITDPVGSVTSIELDDRDLPITLTDADGVTLRYEWDRDGQLLSFGTDGGHTATFAYDAAGLLASAVGPDGEWTDFAHDAGGNVVTSYHPNGRRDYTYSAAGRVRSSTRDGNVEWRIEYGDHGEPVRRFDAAGLATDFEYDSFGRCVAVVADDHRFENHFDALGQLLGTSIDGVRTSTTEFDANGNWVSTTDADGVTLRREVDVMDRTILLVQGDRELLAQSLHPDGQPATIRERGIERTIAVDAVGRPTAITTERGTLQLAYTPGGRLAERTSPAGRTSTYAYDEHGRLVSITDADGTVSEIGAGERRLDLVRGDDELHLEFDELGRLTSWSSANSTTATTFLDGGVRVQTGDQVPALIETDRRGHAVRVTDPAGAVSALERDRFGRITEMATPVETVSVERDDASGVLRIESSAGQVTTMAQTPAGRVETIQTDGETTLDIHHDPSTGALTAISDSLGRTLLSLDHDEHGRIAAATTPEATIEIDTNEMGWAHRIRSSANGSTSWERDADGFVTAIESSAGHRIDVDRSAAGVLQALRSGDLTLDIIATTASGERNAANRITTDSAGRIHRYDDAGRLVESVGVSGDRYAFSYNAASMIEHEVTPFGEREFVYDGAQLAHIDGPNGRHTFEYDAAGRRLAETRPDGTVVRYEWSPLDQLIGIDTVHADGTEQRRSFLHSGLGRIELVDETAIHWDDALSGKPIGIGDRTFLRSGTHVCAIGEASAWSPGIGDDPYGLGVANDGVDLGFHGELSVDGLVFIGARVYDPATRSFLSRDPLQPVLMHTGSSNPYNYCYSDPVNLIDPTGLRPMTMEQFDEWRTSMTTSRWEAFQNGWNEDPFGQFLLIGTVVVGAVLVFTPLSAVGAAILVGVAISAGFGFANKSFNPTRTAVDGIISGLAAGAGGVAAKAVTSPIGKGLVAGGAAGAVGGFGGSVAGQKIDADGSWNDEPLDVMKTVGDTAKGLVVGGISGGLSSGASSGLRHFKAPVGVADDVAEFAIGTGVSATEDLVFEGKVDWKESLLDGTINAGAARADRLAETGAPNDGPAADGPAPDSVTPDGPPPDAPAPDAPVADAPPTDGPAPAAPVADATPPPATEAPAPDAPIVETTPRDVPRGDTPAPDAPSPNQPTAETPSPAGNETIATPPGDAPDLRPPRHDGDTRNPTAETPSPAGNDTVAAQPGDAPAPDLPTAETPSPTGQETVATPPDAPAPDLRPPRHDGDGDGGTQRTGPDDGPAFRPDDPPAIRDDVSDVLPRARRDSDGDVIPPPPGDAPPPEPPPVADLPAADGPVADTPVADGPAADAPVADGPAPDSPAPDAPTELGEVTPLPEGTPPDGPGADADGPAPDSPAPADPAPVDPDAGSDGSRRGSERGQDMNRIVEGTRHSRDSGGKPGTTTDEQIDKGEDEEDEEQSIQPSSSRSRIH